MRVLREQGTLVQLGVSSPARFEWTPWYFKELRLIGSNAFGVETFEGRAAARLRALLRPARATAASTSTGMLTHQLPARRVARRVHAPSSTRATTGAIKVAFDYR